ncbi:MAG: hypothetical protein IJZ70_04615 [Bacteroidales bacterium]|nr:hypothetical protein [Bacteroidales bacterium]
MRILYFLLIHILLSSCISVGHWPEIQEAEYDIETRLLNSEQMGSPCSMAVINENLFVLSTEKQVYLYEEGAVIQKIGQIGRAEYEYQLPMIVRVYKDEIYVWCAMSLKFIVFTLDGIPMHEYQYDSAIADFAVTEDKIIIYNTGRRNENVLCVYDKLSGGVDYTVGNTSEEHRALLKLFSTAPLSVNGNKVWFAHKDKLSICCLNLENSEQTTEAKIKSTSFNVNRRLHTKDIQSYIRTNSAVMMLTTIGDECVVVAAEGVFESGDAGWDDGPRYFSIYNVNNQGNKCVKRIKASSLGDPALFFICNERLYYLFHELTDDDIYLLRSFELL